MAVKAWRSINGYPLLVFLSSASSSTHQIKAWRSINGYPLIVFLSSASSSTHQIIHVIPLPSQPSSSPPTIRCHLSSFPILALHHVASFLNVTPRSLLDHRLRRDAVRVQALTALASRNHSAVSGFSSLVTSGLSLGSGEYFARFGVGMPPRYLYMVPDTGSDVVWLQCAPCSKCYSQTNRVFNPSKFKSYSGIPCGSPTCYLLDSHDCDPFVLLTWTPTACTIR